MASALAGGAPAAPGRHQPQDSSAEEARQCPPVSPARSAGWRTGLKRRNRVTHTVLGCGRRLATTTSHGRSVAPGKQFEEAQLWSTASRFRFERSTQSCHQVGGHPRGPGPHTVASAGEPCGPQWARMDLRRPLHASRERCYRLGPRAPPPRRWSPSPGTGRPLASWGELGLFFS